MAVGAFKLFPFSVRGAATTVGLLWTQLSCGLVEFACVHVCILEAVRGTAGQRVPDKDSSSIMMMIKYLF